MARSLRSTPPPPPEVSPEAQRPCQATPRPRDHAPGTPLLCSSLGPAGGSTRLRPSQPPRSIKRPHSFGQLWAALCQPSSSVSGLAAWLQAGPIPTHYSLEARPRTRLAPSALGLQEPACDPKSLPRQSLPALWNLTPCGLLYPSHFQTDGGPPKPSRSPLCAHHFPQGLTPRPPTGRQLPGSASPRGFSAPP